MRHLPLMPVTARLSMAIGVALLSLSLLLGTISYRGAGAFLAYELVLPLDLAPESLGLSEPWTPDAFVVTREFRNLVAAKAMMAVDVRVGAEDLIDLIDRLGETIDAQAGGI